MKKVIKDEPKHKKERCPNCNRLLRTKNFVMNKHLKKSVCNRCNKKELRETREDKTKSKKQRCPECKRMLRTKVLVVNKKLKKLVCKKCNKRIGSFQWRIPKSWTISKFAITEQEKKVLFQLYTHRGLSSQAAWKKINQHCKALRTIKKKRKWHKSEIKKKVEQYNKDSKVQRKKFLKGIGQG